MKIGIYDSGVGGLLMAKAIVRKLPNFDYVYLGDTKNVPYGGKSEAEIYKLFLKSVKYLFEKENCVLIIVACNTVSTASLRKLQMTYLKKFYPARRVLGMVDPTIEEILKRKLNTVGLIGTSATIKTNRYKTKLTEECLKKNKKIKIYQLATPKLVPFIEAGDMAGVVPVLQNYLKKFRSKNVKSIDALVLACTHYPILKNEIKKILKKNIVGTRPAGSGVKIISQDQFIPKKLKLYLSRHPEITSKISTNKSTILLATKVTPTITNLSQKWFDKNTKLEEIKM